MNAINIIWAFLWFALLSGFLGALLALAAKLFAIKTDERVETVTGVLPGANCGGCGYAGCAALAEAIVKGDAKVNSCVAGGEEVAKKVAAIMGVDAGKTVRMRAQVMCSGTSEYAHKKFVYEGAPNCIAASKLGGGDKLCPNGCIGLGTCVAACKFGAISVHDGVAAVDYKKCRGCGACVAACPKHIIKLIPYNSAHWVGCSSVDNGPDTRKCCDVGCISCGLCQKGCPTGAITVTNFVASIDYAKCIDCGKCVERCPRKIIWSRGSQEAVGVTIPKDSIAKDA